MTDPLLLGLFCGCGAGIATFGRRLHWHPRSHKKLSQRLQYAFSGCLLSIVAGTGVALLTVDHLRPHKVIGLVLVTSVCFDLSTSEGRDYLRDIFLSFVRRSPRRETDENEETK